MDEQTAVVEEVVVPGDIYVGSGKVTPVVLPSGLISVKLDEFTTTATPEQFEAMKSDKPYDDALISVRKWKPTIAKILSILTQDNLTMNDKDFVIQRVDMSILQNYRAATAKLFGVEDQDQVTMQNIIDIVSPAQK